MPDSVIPAGVEFESHAFTDSTGGAVRVFVTLAVNRRMTVRVVNTLGRAATAVIRTIADQELTVSIPVGETSRTTGARRWDDVSHFEVHG